MYIGLVMGLLAGGCTPGAGDSAGDSAGDTAGDSGDIGDTGDTGPTAPLTLTVGEGLTGTVGSLTWADATTLGDPAITVGDVLFSAPLAAGRVDLDPPEPAPEAFLELDPEGAPGLRLAVYVVAAHGDGDGDGVRSGDEAWAGVASVLAIYADGDVDPATGFLPGWNALQVAPGGDIFYADPHDLPLDPNLAASTVAHLGGTSALAGEAVRLALVSEMERTGGRPLDDLWGAPNSATWSVDLDTAPPESHLFPDPGDGQALAMETLLAYTDVDGDEAFTDGDSVLAGACAGEARVGLAWIPTITDLGVAFGWGLRGLHPGWIPVAAGEPGAGLTQAQADTLEVDTACAG